MRACEGGFLLKLSERCRDERGEAAAWKVALTRPICPIPCPTSSQATNFRLPPGKAAPCRRGFARSLAVRSLFLLGRSGSFPFAPRRPRPGPRARRGPGSPERARGRARTRGAR